MQELFFVLLIAGLVLTGVEIFIPGGVLGTIGVIALAGAVIVSFQAYPDHAWLITFGVVVLLILSFLIWVNVFPRTRIGRSLTLASSTASYTATQDGLQELIGQQGETLTECMPGGYARIGGRRMDVVTEGGYVARGKPVNVVRIESNRIVIREIKSA